MAGPIVTISDGQLKGKISENYLRGEFYSFLGIPYAKPPIDDLRFKAPVPVEPWTDVRDATKEGPECPSRHMIFGYYIGNEDNCLHLNVFTKEVEKTANSPPKPVMFYIHGGGFLHGANTSESYGPEYLMTEDIVLVITNYRLGALGFLSLEDPSLGVPGNAGMKDLVLALKWVQKNIKNFNGDPQNVTIFGESAGGCSVHYLYLSPLTKGLFHKAIAQSGNCLNPWGKGKTNGKILAKDLGLKETDEKKILEHLRTLPPRRIVNAQHQFPETFSANDIRPYGPVVEGPSDEPAFLSEESIDAIKNGHFHHVPLMMGYTSQEGMLFEAIKYVIPSAMKKTIDFEAQIPFDLNLEKGSQRSKEIAAKIEKFYFTESKLEQEKDKFYLLKTDSQFLHGLHRSIQLQKQKIKVPIYLYRMTLDTQINFYKRLYSSKALPAVFILTYIAHTLNDGIIKRLVLKFAKLVPRNEIAGACHADDLGYLFKGFLNEELTPGSIEDISIRRFVKLWTNFAKTGNPTPDEDKLLNSVQWKPVTKEVNHFLDIGEKLKSGTNPDSERMQFWDSIYSMAKK